MPKPKQKKKIWSAIRLGEDGKVDDIAITGDTFRLERMDDNYWWCAVYRRGKRVTFNISGKSKIDISVEENEIGCRED